MRPALSAPARRPRHRGFTLIELMLVVTIIGVLAALAIPQYVQYTVRATALNGLSAADPLRKEITEYVAANKRIPASYEDLGLNPDDFTQGTDNVACLGIVRGVSMQPVPAQNTVYLTVRFFADNVSRCRNESGDNIRVPQPLAGNTLVLDGVLAESGSFAWRLNPELSTADLRYLPKVQ